MKIRLDPLRGMRDLITPESEELYYLKKKFSEVATKYGYELIILPTLELFEVFSIKSGPEIKRSMYVFNDKGGRQVCLRPEFTAGVARAYLRLMRDKPKPIKLYYIGQAFRYEEPQAGRYREFFQAGVEYLGDSSINADIELLLLIRDYYRMVGLDNYRIKIGNIGLYRHLFSAWGIPEETQDLIIHYLDKKEVEKALSLVKKYNTSGQTLIEELMSISSSKPEEIREQVSKLRLDNKSLEELEKTIKILELSRELGVGDSYIDLGFARGLAYYTGFIFEVVVPDATFSIGGGGRYDKLISIYDGEDLPATGFALGLDRMLLVLNSRGWQPPEKNIKVMLLALTNYTTEVDQVATTFRNAGYVVDVRIVTKKKVGEVLGDAAEKGYDYAVFLGEKELREGVLTIKNLREKTQKTVRIDMLGEVIHEFSRKNK
ncbi:MAG: histidine--tRNA ligase [Desulfurococcaceae archaeon TW002]